MTENESKQRVSFKKGILDDFSSMYGISGAERLLVMAAINNVEERIKKQTGRGLDFADIVDIAFELESYGFNDIAKENWETLLKYGQQLVWEGEEFHKPEKKRSGEEIIKRILLGKRDYNQENLK